MPIRFEHSGFAFTADTPEEAAWIIDWLDRRAERRSRIESYHAELSKVLGKLPNADQTPSPWTPEVFRHFIERLGEAQKLVLSALILHGSVQDHTLREAVGAPNNQVLSGVLSGISKQAKRSELSPRDVFWFENKRRKGTRQSIYHVAEDFRDAARSLDWPPTFLRPNPDLFS